MTSRPVAGVIAALAFLCELSMLVLLVVAGLGLSDSAPGRVALAIALPVAAAVIWGFWMAPRSRHRLPDPQRFAAQGALFIVVGWLVASAGHLILGIGFAVVAGTVFGWARRLPAATVTSTRT